MTIARQVDDFMMAEINITPFTDVLLVLIIIFMILAALEVPPGFQKHLEPTARHTASQTIPLRHIEIAIARNGRISIDGVPIARLDLYPAVARAVRAHRHLRGYDAHIDLIADKDAAYDAVIKVLDAARLADDNDVGFVTY